MSSEIGNFTFSTIVLFIYVGFLAPALSYFGGLPPAALWVKYGCTPGEGVIITLICVIVIAWSFFQFITFVLSATGTAIAMIITNEKVVNFCGAIKRKANRTIGRKIRILIRDIYRDMKGHESL